MTASATDDVRVLHVDDDSDFADLTATALERTDEDIQVATEHAASAGLECLDEGDIDCVVSDLDMPGMDGLEFLRTVRERHGDLPFVLFTGTGSETVASDAISAGVTDYLQKSGGTEQFELLANRIRRAVGERRARTALEASQRRHSRLIANLPGMVYRCHNEPGWPMAFVSEGARELAGYEPSAIEEGEVSWGEDVIDPRDREAVWTAVQSALDRREPFQVTYRIETADGETRWVWEQGSGIFEDGEVTALEGVITDVTERKEREREIEEQRAFIEGLVDALGDPFYLVGTDGSLLRWNDRVAELSGYSDAELAEMDVTDLFPEDEQPALEEAMVDTLERGTSTAELDVLLKDGDRRTFEFRGSRVDDAEGELVGIVGIARDVTERTEREAVLERYRTLVENVGDPMYVLDADGRIEMINNAMVEHLGTSREAVVGELPDKFMPEADVERGRAIVQELLEGEADWRTWEMRTVRADGSERLNENQTAVITDEDGNLEASVGVIRDISARKERERELERYETVVTAVGDVVYSLDPDGNFRFVNDAVTDLTGYDPEDLVGEHISRLVGQAGVEQGRELISELLESEDRTRATYEMDVLTTDGEAIPTENHMSLLPMGEGGLFRGSAGVIRDITERKERERRLEEFASVVSHDLRSPLNVITGRVTMARESGDDEHLDAAAEAADRMDDMIEDLLSLARQGKTVGEFATVDLETVAWDAWRTVETDDADLDTHGLGTLEADRDRLREFFENLFTNAVEHGGGDVTVTVEGTAEGFAVSDDGVGIPEEDRESVFDHGYTTSDDGTGFGLAIVDRIADAHGWTIEAGESPSGGARFEVRT